MTFYQELQLDQAGSKSYISSFQKRKDKLKHTGIYLFKILLNVAFCTVFIALFCTLFGAENSVAGLTVLLSIMVFRHADLGIRASHGLFDILIVFTILAIGPKVSNLLPAGWAFCANVIFIMLLMVLGCHNVIMFNHSTLVLAYLMLQGYDVSGAAYIFWLVQLLRRQSFIATIERTLINVLLAVSLKSLIYLLHAPDGNFALHLPFPV